MKFAEIRNFRRSWRDNFGGPPNRKPVPLYGRRVGWCCATRILKPRIVVETGVADGLGSAVLLRALERNRAEGSSGKLIAIDIDDRAGWLVTGALRNDHELVIEDSATALPRLLANRTVDLFIHDSDHHYAHELKEYEMIARHLDARVEGRRQCSTHLGLRDADGAQRTSAIISIST